MPKPSLRERALVAAPSLVEAYMRQRADDEVVFLCDIASDLERALRIRFTGLRRDLFESVFDYEGVLPCGLEANHIALGPSASMFSVLNPFFEGERRAQVVRPLSGPFEPGTDAHMQRYLTGPGVSPRQQALPF